MVDFRNDDITEAWKRKMKSQFLQGIGDSLKACELMDEKFSHRGQEEKDSGSVNMMKRWLERKRS